MSGALRTAVAVLLLVASAAAATPLAAPSDVGDAAAAPAPVVPQANTSARLMLPRADVRTTRFGVVSIDVGGAVAADAADLHGAYTAAHVRETFAGAGTDRASRRAAVNRSAARLQQRIDELVARERAALAAYNAGRIDTRAYLRELVTIQATSESLRAAIDRLYTYDRATGMPVPATEIARMKVKLAPLTGPVRSRVAAAMAGETTEPVRVYVETSETGFVLSYVEEGEFTTHYVREAYYGDGLDNLWADTPSTIDGFTQRLAELYPWVSENNVGSSTILTNTPRYYRAGVYGIAYTHPQGTSGARDLVVYYDAGTKDVFYEVQRLDADRLPMERLARTSDEDLSLTVRGLYGSGPITLNVTDTVTGEPVDATVFVDGERVGTTGGDHLQVVAPRRTFTVTASYEGRNVTATVDRFK